MMEENTGEEETGYSCFSKTYLQRLQAQCNALVENLQRGYHKRTLNRIEVVRSYLDDIEAEIQPEPPVHVDQKVLVFSSKPETFLKLSFHGNLFAIDEDEMRFMKALFNLVDELEAKKKKD